MCSRRRFGWCLMVWKLIFWWLFELYLVRRVPWWLLRFLRLLLSWLFLFIVAFSIMIAQSSVVVSFTGWQQVFLGSVVQLPCRHFYIELSAKYARRNIDHVRLLAYFWGWARFAVTDPVGVASGSRVRSPIVLPRGLTRRAGMSCLACVRLIWWLSWSETNRIWKVNVGAVVALSFRCLTWRFWLASRRDFGKRQQHQYSPFVFRSFLISKSFRWLVAYSDPE